MSYTGELFALITTLSWSIGIFPFMTAARKLGATALNHFRLALAVVLLAVVAFVMGGISPVELFTAPRMHNWLWLGASGIVGLSLGDYFWFHALTIVGARTSSVFATLAPGGALLFGILLLHEHLNLMGVIGIVITVCGVVALILGRRGSAESTERHYGSHLKGYIFGVVAALCQGCGIVLAKIGMKEEGFPDFPPVHATWIRMAAGTAVLFLVSGLGGRLMEFLRPALRNQDGGLRSAVIGTLFGPVIGVSCSLYAASLLDASVTQTLLSTVPVFVLILSRIIYKERISVASALGAAVAIAGVLVLIWREELGRMVFGG